MLFSLLCLFAFFNASVLALPGKPYVPDYFGARGGNGQCTDLLTRKEWRTLTDPEKKDYIGGVKCLMSHPAQHPVYPEAVTRFDEFQAYHIYVADAVHAVGQFLPWHRLYLRMYDLAMRSECGYKGPTPYWDWSLDSKDATSLHTSPVWDPNNGFGGNGVPGTYTLPPNINFTSNRIFPDSFVGCVKDGPFADYTLHLGPGQLRTNHFLVRGMNESQYINLDAQAVARTLAQPTYEQFWIELEGQPLTTSFRMHDGGHNMVGGEMSNFYSSPGDPLFFLHHANLDRIWWQWQQASPSHLYEISGRSTPVPPYQNVTLDFVLPMGELGPSLPIRDVMDIHEAPNCYNYA